MKITANLTKLLKNIGIILLVFLVISGLFTLFSSPFSSPEKVSLTQLAEKVNQEQVKEITVTGNKLSVVYEDGKEARSVKEEGVALSETLKSYGAQPQKLSKVNVNAEQEADWGWLGIVALGIAPLLIFGFFFWMMFKQAKGKSMKAMDFSKTKARLFGEEGKTPEEVSFDDVGGLEEAKDELDEVVEFLKNPKKFLKMGAQIPRGVLLMGPPGTGKTLLAKAIAHQADVPFYSISGSEFIELFVGVGASRVRDLFDKAKKNQPSIVFIDEIDAIGRTRGAGVGGGHDEREQTLNQILSEMDGFEEKSTTVVMGATNRPDVLDPALLRPGRFDRRVTLNMPDIKAREEILKIHARKKPLTEDTDLREVAERTPGFSGADLENVVNEAAILAAQKDQKNIKQPNLLEAIERVLLGRERKSHILSDKEKKIAAYHEAGHALLASLLPEAESVRKVSIIARGPSAGGYTLKTPSEEKKMKAKSEFLAELAVLLGGYSAEELQFGEITTGASNDLKKASSLAKKLVKKYGMSELGPISYGGEKEAVFLGKEMAEAKDYSEEVAAEIDEEISQFVNQAQDKATKLLKKNKELLDKIAETLIEKETIEKEEFKELVEGAEI